MMYRKNINLDYVFTLFRNFNLANGIWLIYLASLGYNYFEIALFEVIFHISSLSFEIPTGVIADIFGRKTSRALGVILYIVYIILLLNANSFFIVALAFAICGISYTLESGAGEALVYDSLKESNQEDEFMKVNGRKEVVFQLSSFGALLISGAIASIHFKWAFYTTGGFFLLGLLVILFMKEVPVKREKKRVKELLKDQFITSSKVVFENKRLFMLILIGAMMLSPITTIFFFIQNRLYELEFPLTVITIILGLHALMAAFGGLFAQKLEKKYGEKNILFFVPLFIVVCFVLLNIGQYMYIPFILLGFFDSIFYVVLSDYINKLVESNKRATVLSFFGMAFSIVMIFVFLLVGLVGHVLSLQISFMVLGAIVIVFYILLLPVLKGTKEL